MFSKKKKRKEKRKRKKRQCAHPQLREKKKKNTTTTTRKEKKKKKERGNVSAQKKIKKKEINSTWVFLSIKQPNFLSILGRKFFGRLGEKTHRPYHLFSFLPTQPNILKKFSFLFSLQNFSSTLFLLQTNTP